MSENTLHVLDAGTVAYDRARRLQKRLLAAKKAGDARDFLVLLEHPPVVTLGRGAAESNLKVPREALAARGVEVYDIERGGDVTYHGPGQLVGYPIVDLKRAGLDVHEFLRLLESALISAAGDLGVEADRRPGLTGVWTSKGKVAAIGVAVSRWISYHGFALNVKRGISGWEFIVPCGLAGESVTSLEDILDDVLDMAAVREIVTAALAHALAGRRVVRIEGAEAEALL